LQIEKKKLNELVEKLVAFFRGTKAEGLVVNMQNCLTVIGKKEYDMDMTQTDLAKLEDSLKNEILTTNTGGSFDSRTMNDIRMDNIKLLRNEISCKEHAKYDLEDQIQLQLSKLRSFEDELNEFRSTEWIPIPVKQGRNRNDFDK